MDGFAALRGSAGRSPGRSGERWRRRWPSRRGSAVFDLVFERFISAPPRSRRCARASARARRTATASRVTTPAPAHGRRGPGRRPGRRPARPRRCASWSSRRSATATSPRCATSRGCRSRRSAGGQGFGVLGVDVQRIGARSACAQRRTAAAAHAAGRRAAAADARRDPALRAAPAARARAQPDRAPAGAAAVAPAQRTRPRPAVGPLQDLAARAPRRGPAQSAGWRRRATRRAAPAPRPRRRAAHDARVAADGGVPVELKFRPKRRGGRDLRPVRRVNVGQLASAFFPASCTRCTTRSDKMRSFVSSSGSLEVTDVFERERDFKAVSDAISKDAGVADVSGYTDYGRVWREFLELVVDDLHRGDGDRARGRAHNGRDRARTCSPASPPRRAGRSGSTRAAAVLELRRLRDRRVRAPLRGLRVLDDQAAGGLRSSAHATVR